MREEGGRKEVRPTGARIGNPTLSTVSGTSASEGKENERNQNAIARGLKAPA